MKHLRKHLIEFERIRDQIEEAHIKKRMTFQEMIMLFKNKGISISASELYTVMKHLKIKRSQKETYIIRNINRIKSRKKKRMEHWRKIAMENPDIENSLKEKLKKIEYELKELRKAHKEKTKELNRQKRNIETVLRNLREVK